MKRSAVSAFCLASAFTWAHLVHAQPGRGTGGGLLGELTEQVDANTAAIEILESKTTLSDLACDPDEIARFDGTRWVCAPDPTAFCDAVNRAICVRADQEGDSLRPLTCEPRCDCFEDAFGLGPLTACEEKAPGVFEATVVEERARCVPLHTALGTIAGCETSSKASCACEMCGTFFPVPCNCTGCSDGEACSTPLFPVALGGVCVKPCSGDDDCPLAEIPVTLNLSGVSEPGGAAVAQCSCAGTNCAPRRINSNDGQSCLARIEAELRTPCTRLPQP